MIPEVEKTHMASLTGFYMFYGEPSNEVISFMQVQGIENMREYITAKGWNKITKIAQQPWGGKTCEITTIDGYIMKVWNKGEN